MGIPRPPPQENLREAARRAFAELAGVPPATVAARAGGRLDGSRVEVVILGRTVSADLERGVVLEAGGAAAADAVAAPVARYLARSGGLEESPGDWIGFADDADARGYLGPFRGRGVAPFAAAFGRRPGAFDRAAKALGGERLPSIEAPGASAWRIRVLPRVDLVFVLNPGDEELPAEGQVLFPRALFRAFAVDDVVSLADLAGRALRGRWPGRAAPTA